MSLLKNVVKLPKHVLQNKNKKFSNLNTICSRMCVSNEGRRQKHRKKKKW